MQVSDRSNRGQGFALDSAEPRPGSLQAAILRRQQWLADVARPGQVIALLGRPKPTAIPERSDLPVWRASPPPPASWAVSHTWKEPVSQVETALRSIADSLALGQANRIAAGANTAIGLGGPGGIRQRFDHNLAEQESRDRYDAIHRPQARRIGGLLGAALSMELGGTAAVSAAGRLPPMAKGTLGEGLSALKTVSKGDWPVRFQVRTPLSRSHTIADHLTRGGTTVEAKFGPTARLSRSQQRAFDELGRHYRVDWWGPEHVRPGAAPATGLLAWLTGQRGQDH